MIKIGDEGQPDFDKPLELMSDCHRRVEHFLDVLVGVAEKLRGRALDDENRRALQTTTDYFASAAKRHTEDEEISLFPRMRASADARAVAAMAKIDALEADHRRGEIHHERIDTLCRQWLGRGTLDAPLAAELFTRAQELRDLYTHHIYVEDHEVFPIGAQVLDAAQLSAIGAEMKARRVSDHGRPGSRCAQRRARL